MKEGKIMPSNNLLSDMESDSGSAPDQIDNLKDQSLDAISKLAQGAANLEREIAETEDFLKAHKAALHKITDEQLPEALEEINLQKFTLKDGSEISVKPIYAASIPKDRREEAFAWLRDHHFGDLVKNNVSVTFGRGEDEIAKDFVSLCSTKGFVPKQLEKVEPMTLKAWLREQVEAGHPVPLDLFGAFISQRAIIKRSK
jgi:hypothetical protein|tara:strand:+ start:6930 stop:7529 length:600 start_codon:yes stop_codon:yes gene_type:complete